MALFLAIDNTQVLSNKIEFKNNNNKDLIAFKNLDKLREYILKTYKTFKGWYFIEIDMKKDKLDEDDESTYNKEKVYIEKPAKIDMKNKKPYPLMDDGKIWKTIPGFSAYMASDEGEILTLKTGNYTKGVSAGHYLKVSIFKDGSSVSKMEYVHILIAKAFHGLGKPGQVVMHLDDNKFNCKKDNLQWGSQSQNIQDVWNKRKEKYNMENYNILNDLNTTISKVEHLRSYTDTISNESGFINKISDYVLSQFSNIKDLFVSKYEKLSNIIDMNNSLDVSDIRTNAIKVGREIKDIKFKDIDSRLSPVTLGLKVNLIEYNEVMSKHIDEADKVVSDSIRELNVTLSSVISDESFRKSFKPKDMNLKKTRDLNYKLREEFAKLIDPNSKIDRLRISALIPNLASVQPLAHSTALLANRLKNNKLDELNKRVKEIHEKVNILKEYIEDKDNQLTMSKSTLDGLADALDVNAEMLTLYSTYYVLINQQVGMTNNLIEIIKE